MCAYPAQHTMPPAPAASGTSTRGVRCRRTGRACMARMACAQGLRRACAVCSSSGDPWHKARHARRGRTHTGEGGGQACMRSHDGCHSPHPLPTCRPGEPTRRAAGRWSTPPVLPPAGKRGPQLLPQQSSVSSSCVGPAAPSTHNRMLGSCPDPRPPPPGAAACPLLALEKTAAGLLATHRPKRNWGTPCFSMRSSHPIATGTEDIALP